MKNWRIDATINIEIMIYPMFDKISNIAIKDDMIILGV